MVVVENHWQVSLGSWYGNRQAAHFCCSVHTKAIEVSLSRSATYEQIGAYTHHISPVPAISTKAEVCRLFLLT